MDDEGCTEPSGLHCKDWVYGDPCCWCGLQKELPSDNLTTTEGASVSPESEN